MSLNAAKASTGGGKRPDPVAVGTYPARLVQVIDLVDNANTFRKHMKCNAIANLWLPKL